MYHTALNARVYGSGTLLPVVKENKRNHYTINIYAVRNEKTYLKSPFTYNAWLSRQEHVAV